MQCGHQLAPLAVVNTLREVEAISGTDQSRQGPIYSFVPAHGASRAGAVAEHLSRTLAEGFGRSVLLANFAQREDRILESRRQSVLDARELHPSQLGPAFENARERYSVICADLSGAEEARELEVLRASDAVFLVGSADWASLELTREKAEWLRSADLGERCGLLLWHASDGATAEQAEEYTGLPVCSLVDREEHLERLARWLAAQHAKVEASERVEEHEYALAS